MKDLIKTTRDRQRLRFANALEEDNLGGLSERAVNYRYLIKWDNHKTHYKCVCEITEALEELKRIIEHTSVTHATINDGERIAVLGGIIRESKEQINAIKQVYICAFGRDEGIRKFHYRQAILEEKVRVGE